jgi:DNA-binding beta-propeller fold protein YncE
VYDPALGTVSTFIGPGNGLDGVHGLAQAASGDWYVASFISDRVLRYNGNGTFIEIAIAPGAFGLNNPVDILIDELQRMYVSSLASNAILLKDLTTGTISELVAPASGGLDAPRYLSLEPGTNHLLVVTFSGNGQYLRFNRMTGVFLGPFLTPLAGGISGDPSMVVFKPDAVPGCYADCDGDGVLSIDDFICFQTFFAIGC